MESLYDYWRQDQLEVRVFVTERVIINAAWRHRNYPLGHWRLYRNDRDGAKLHFAREVFPLQKNRVYILPAGLRFTTACEGEVGHFFVHFNVSGLPDLALRTLFRRPLILPESSALKAQIDELEHRLVEAQHTANAQNDADLAARHGLNIAFQWRAKSVVYEALAQCVGGATPEQIESCWQFTQEVQPVITALRFIEENLSHGLNNAMLAEMCGFSRDHFIRVFSATMKQTPAVYIRERRLAESLRLLLFSDHNLDLIAQHTGFCDRAHFSRTFKTVYGVSPTHYRINTHGTNFKSKI